MKLVHVLCSRSRSPVSFALAESGQWQCLRSPLVERADTTRQRLHIFLSILAEKASSSCHESRRLPYPCLLALTLPRHPLHPAARTPPAGLSCCTPSIGLLIPRKDAAVNLSWPRPGRATKCRITSMQCRIVWLTASSSRNTVSSSRRMEVAIPHQIRYRTWILFQVSSGGVPRKPGDVLGFLSWLSSEPDLLLDVHSSRLLFR